MQAGQVPFVTIVMPVLNEENFISEVLGELLGQVYPRDRYEIIVADGGSNDLTRQIVDNIAKEHPQVILVDNPGRLPSSGRNVGFKNGRGDYFLIVDAHCRIDNDRLLKNLVDCFERTGADCLCRPQPFIIPDRPTMQSAIGLARTSRLGHSANSFIHSSEEGWVSPVSAGCAYRRDVFARVGFVDETFDACEDVEFNYRVERAGLRSFFSPSIAVWYYPRENLGGLWRQLLRYGEGRIRFVWKHPESLTIDMLLPVFFVLGVMSGPLIKFLSVKLFYLYAGFLGLYMGLLCFESFRKCSGNATLAPKMISAFLVVHFALAIGMIRGLSSKLASLTLILPNRAA
jgi:succinoglycan biosynthesis protein ExoA